MASPRTLLQRFIVWLAEGCGIGRIPFAPGTFGTLLGFPWIWLLMLPDSRLLYCAATVAGILTAVWIGFMAERITGEKDPGRFVIDEIAAMPVAFLPVILIGAEQPEFEALMTVKSGWVFGVCFAFFRIFDIAKPYPADISQQLPGGWGFVIDDVFAAIYSALVLWLLLWFVPLPA